MHSGFLINNYIVETKKTGTHSQGDSMNVYEFIYNLNTH